MIEIKNAVIECASIFSGDRGFLDAVDFSTDTERGQGILWGNECEGMCGV